MDYSIVVRPPKVQQDDIHSPTSVTIRWNSPFEPDDIIRYTINYVIISSAPEPEPGCKRQADELLRVECIRGGEDNIDRNVTVVGNPPNTNITLDDLSECSCSKTSVYCITYSFLFIVSPILYL